MSQCSDIHAHLKKHGSITPLDALQFYGCFRLAARIGDLREQGIAIDTAMIGSSSGKRFAKYSIKRKQVA